jgi:hypothetical protein
MTGTTDGDGHEFNTPEEYFKALHEVLHARDIKHPVRRKNCVCWEDFNWLDAAPFDVLAEMTIPILVFCAQKMAVRAEALQEMEFKRRGYSGSGLVERGVIPGDVRYFMDKSLSFYQRLKSRLARLGHLDSINRREMVIHFPGAKPIPPSDGDAPEETLYDVYEEMRRSNITECYAAILYDPRDPRSCQMDFLDAVSATRLDESADAIILAGRSRMAIRSSARLDLAWRQKSGSNDWAILHTRPLLHDLIDERDYHVDNYLKVREEEAKVEHLKSIRARSAPGGTRKIRRPHMRVKQASGA